MVPRRARPGADSNPRLACRLPRRPPPRLLRARHPKVGSAPCHVATRLGSTTASTPAGIGLGPSGEDQALRPAASAQPLPVMGAQEVRGPGPRLRPKASRRPPCCCLAARGAA